MRRTASFHPGAQHGDPVPVINVTPFIDVLLVLMIMIILTVPIATHKLPIDLPTGDGAALPDEPHKLMIDSNGALNWDGRAVGDAELSGLLSAISQSPQATLLLQADPETRYERFDHILKRIKQSGVTRMGFVGNETMKL